MEMTSGRATESIAGQDINVPSAGPAREPRGTARAVLVLFLLSPLIGEIVAAALRFSYLGQLPRVIGILCFYGAGVVLVREIVQRLGLNGWGLLLLGTAYAVLEEGLGLQTIFNPLGPGGGETVYGRAFEVNWIWAVAVTGYHVVWSIVIPILLAHLLFPAKRHTAWLSRPMLGVFGGIFTIGLGAFVFISLMRSGYRLSIPQIAGGIVLTVVLVWAATGCRKPWTTSSTRRGPKPVTAGLFGFVTGLAGLVLYLVALIGTQAPFMWWTVGALLFAAGVALVFRRWAARPAWVGRHQLAASYGAVLAAWVFGLLLVANGGRTDDIVFHFLVLAAVTVGYWWLRRRQPAYRYEE